MSKVNLTTERINAIDTFRGITILVMIFVNELAGVSGIPPWMKHMPADADAMTFVDVVFPAFLFIVGMSIPFAIAYRVSKGDSFLELQKHILLRAAGLLILGVFMVNAEGDYNEAFMPMPIGAWSLLFYVAAILIWNVYTFKRKEIAAALRVNGILILVILAFLYRAGENGEQNLSPQWWGILGLIGWAYVIACTLYQLSNGNKVALLLFIITCIAYYAIGHSAWINNQSQGVQILFSQGGHAAHSSIVLCGLLLSLLLFDKSSSLTIKIRFAIIAGFTLLLIISGWLLRPYFGISKIYATPTWCLYCAAICTAIFILLYLIIDLKKFNRWTTFFQPAATNALLVYCIPFIIYALFQLLNIHFPEFLYEGITGILWAATYAIIITGFAILLNRMKIKLQL